MLFLAALFLAGAATADARLMARARYALAPRDPMATVAALGATPTKATAKPTSQPQPTLSRSASASSAVVARGGAAQGGSSALEAMLRSFPAPIADPGEWRAHVEEQLKR